MTIKVGQLMGRDAVAVRPGTRRAEIVSAMDKYRLPAVTVLDAESRPIGVVPEEALRAEDGSRAGRTAEELMRSPAVTVTPGVTAREAARLMYCHELRQLPVVDPADGRFMGVVTQDDVVPIFDSLSEEVRREVDATIREAAHLDPNSLTISVDQGTVGISGEVPAGTPVAHLIEAVRGVDGVVEVDCGLTFPTGEGMPAQQGDGLAAVVEAATWAPSIHNSQPWSFAIDGEEICLRSDADRRLPVSDPQGRELTISCGAALFNMQTLVRATGHRPVVRTLPDPDRPGLVATVRVGPEEPAPEEICALRDEIPRRRTHRGGFSDRPVPEAVLDSLVRAAAMENVRLIPLRSATDVTILAALTTVAQESQARDPEFEMEMIRWGLRPGSSRRDGVPAEAYPRRDPEAGLEFAQRDYSRGQGWGGEVGQRRETGVVVLLTTIGDEPADWVQAGQALESVLLYASSQGVRAAFHTQPLEYPLLREFVRTVLCSGEHPQIILRLGYCAGTPQAFRRPLVEVLS
ncbi:Acg family FMN-binding oxidoreductase [Herbidospora yilanensis]|uniref:Acg family FMN-binding oxidoreductase n=1 Tax=Herbidospora yilanensis TaxID=354426 RepID=UPI0009FE6653|nr:CBS domain-containing protein [Herbidospora yilanensis]